MEEEQGAASGSRFGEGDGAKEGDDFGVGDTMMPSDGSMVKEEDDGYVGFEDNSTSSSASSSSSSRTSTASGAKASAMGSSKAKEVENEEDEGEGEEQNELLEEEEYDLTPTTMAVGPTKKAPMTAKPNAVSPVSPQSLL